MNRSFLSKTRIKPLLLWGVIIAAALAVTIPSALAASTAQGVALNADADCTNADLDITLTTVGATREYGLVTNAAGDNLLEFEGNTGIGTFSGTFVGYGMPLAPDQPEGTIIGSYAYVGETPPSAADTGEFFVLYECSDLGPNTVLDTCYGPYGTCPKTAAEALAGTAAGCEASLNISATAVVGAFVADAQVYSEPGVLTEPVITIPAGKTYWVLGLDATSQYYKIYLQCQPVWVPASTMGPNFDNVWLGAPLPTEIVD